MSLEAWGGARGLVSASHLEKSEGPRLDGGDCKNREDRSVVVEAAFPQIGGASVCAFP